MSQGTPSMVALLGLLAVAGYQNRDKIADMAVELGFSKSRAGTVAIAATEAGTNLVKHGGGGSIVVQSMIQNGLRGIELFALDRGGGISNIAASLRDGHSTAGTAGIGLGALSRLCSSFDVYSQPAAGTAVRCVVWSDEAPVLDTDLESGVICIPLKGETACGDDWNLHASKGRYVLLVVDGLGHGPEAAAAALAAKDIAERNAQRTPAEQIDAIHVAGSYVRRRRCDDGGERVASARDLRPMAPGPRGSRHRDAER